MGSQHFAGAVEASSVSQSHALARARWGTCRLFLTLLLTLLLSQSHGHVVLVLARARWGTDLERDIQIQQLIRMRSDKQKNFLLIVL